MPVDHSKSISVGDAVISAMAPLNNSKIETGGELLVSVTRRSCECDDVAVVEEVAVEVAVAVDNPTFHPGGTARTIRNTTPERQIQFADDDVVSKIRQIVNAYHDLNLLRK